MMERAPQRVISRENPLIVRLRRLAADPTGYRRAGSVWLEGDHLCRALLARGGRPQHCVVSDAGWADAETAALAGAAPKVTVVPEALFRAVSSLESPARIGFVVDLAIAPGLRAGVPTVVLDRVQDAGNVGSILRSAAAFGFVQVAALTGTAGLWAPKVLRAGMGAHFGLHLVEGLDVPDLDELGVPLLATSSHAVQDLSAAQLPWPCAWIFGHEGQGVRPSLADRAAATLRIPQPGGEESLNVAAAAAVCLYASSLQR